MADLHDNRRYVFLNASFLSKQYKTIPADVLDNAIFLFNAKRSWMFPSNRDEMLEARSNSTKYLEFDEEYKSIILHKEKAGLVYWLLPDGSFQKFSTLLEGIKDPVSRENYLPLILGEDFWLSDFVAADAKYSKDANVIISSAKGSEFDYDAVMELLYQSNPTLVPTLYWAES
ncbi:hypothetical protein NQ176_g9072 [Zarea fungicola]|uniref:Uncharacterized protein n=1 Tax=Zarea fungicola TaxID=93591 RepID=A0ACC1MR19_9HYPO|nr:hypothetical protein NQ176_g9072 [Lecanicillium fungicola]